MTTVSHSLSNGLIHHRAGKLEQAAQVYDEILRVDPANADALHLRGVLALQAGNPSEAIRRVRCAIEQRPNVPQYHNNLAAAYRSAGELDEAIASYRTSLKMDPNCAEAYNNLGNSLRDKGNVNEAIECFHRALELDPEFKTARENLEATLPSRELLNDIPPAEAIAPETIEVVSNAEQFSIDDVVPTNTDRLTKTVLHVGCGSPNPELLHERFRDKQWREVRLDINPDAKPDIVASLTDMQAVASESVDAVWSSHNIEHLYAHEVPIALGEFYRVLRPGGFVYVTMPDLRQIAQFVVDDKLEDVAYVSPAGPITPLDCLYGLRPAIARGNEFMAHRTGFTAKTLQGHLLTARFVDVTIWTSEFALWGEGFKR